ncbi:hypothetical protein BATDEDRAFT_28299 [Batrachochytrium dendrobatidis JAM81]|uniref:Uncharacterized protein n=1 Tax=Batrachochytrium dendrobatidis (strain JAM81 / FGSC 10211) TaxID=684364 RepID=F4PDL6_BATDJ|nr:uncharacterized protein BATDEDRAFT_28299 [Batrachochytrium dendrobatidis JAM81]EGF76701.1 hypothetical protein BATDEDRAFT_28299 [Batrachochytrium dendrobatidis JAM81]|eukprot:XP_006682615.1 hypothetical protein BATDEDRAFT_28299 [Batrachochytrium dendrobatidis JAM81]
MPITRREPINFVDEFRTQYYPLARLKVIFLAKYDYLVASPSTEKLDEPNYEEDGCETPIKQKNDKDKNKDKDMVMSSIDTLAGETSPDHYKTDENSKDFPSSMASYFTINFAK